MRKVLIVTQEFPPDVGGAGSVASQNARKLASDYDVEVVTRYKEGRRLTQVQSDHPFRLRQVKTLPKIWSISFGWSLRQMDLSKYDAIILNDIGAVYVAGATMKLHELRKALVYVHGSEPSQVLSSPSFSYRLVGIPAYYRRALCHCYRVIAVSKYQEKRFIQAAQVPDIGDKTSVVYAGIDKSLFYRDPDPHLRSEWEEEGVKILLSVSRIEKEKGFPAMYRIFRTLINEGHRFRWVIVGSGGYLATLRERVLRDGLQDHVVCTGPVPREQLRLYYSSADIFWLLSEREAESFGLVYLEANACGLPVIACRKAGAVEAVDEGKSGYLVDSEEECRRILTERVCESIGLDSIQAHAERFSAERMARQLEDNMPLMKETTSM